MGKTLLENEGGHRKILKTDSGEKVTMTEIKRTGEGAWLGAMTVQL